MITVPPVAGAGWTTTGCDGIGAAAAGAAAGAWAEAIPAPARRAVREPRSPFLVMVAPMSMRSCRYPRGGGIALVSPNLTNRTRIPGAPHAITLPGKARKAGPAYRP